MLPQIKQFLLEYHLFPKWPAKKEYPRLLKLYKRLHDAGFLKFYANLHPLTHKPKKFNIQADVGYVNTMHKDRFIDDVRVYTQVRTPEGASVHTKT